MVWPSCFSCSRPVDVGSFSGLLYILFVVSTGCPTPRCSFQQEHVQYAKVNTVRLSALLTVGRLRQHWPWSKFLLSWSLLELVSFLPCHELEWIMVSSHTSLVSGSLFFCFRDFVFSFCRCLWNTIFHWQKPKLKTTTYGIKIQIMWKLPIIYNFFRCKMSCFVTGLNYKTKTCW